MGRVVGYLPNLVMCIKHWMCSNKYSLISSCNPPKIAVRTTKYLLVGVANYINYEFLITAAEILSLSPS
jgi:hypothetical protein